MEALVQQYLEALKKQELITIQIPIGQFIITDAANEAACTLINEQFANEKKYLLIAEPVWLLKYLANPPLDFDEWWSTDTPTFYEATNFVDIATNANKLSNSLYIYLVQEDLCYALIKRFRKPLFGVLLNPHKDSVYLK